MNSLSLKNLQKQNIALKIQETLKAKAPGSVEHVNFKINLHGQNTGYSVKVSSEALQNEELKSKLTSSLEIALQREVEFGTRHIYVGHKFTY